MISKKTSKFTPSTDSRLFRKALSRYTTGITVITALYQRKPIGITVNSFTSISLSPALVMWSIDKKSYRYEAFTSASSFAIHVLSSDQKHICDAFVKSPNAFHEIDYRMNEESLAIINDCLAVFECSHYAHHNAGDHTIILGEVHRAQERAGNSLIFANGAYATLPISETCAR